MHFQLNNPRTNFAPCHHFLNRFFDNTTTCAAQKESIFLSYTSGICIGGGDFAYSVDCSDGECTSSC